MPDDTSAPRELPLVAADGTIDWCCPVRFAAPSVFAAILDGRDGGHWRIAPDDDDARVAQFYFPDSNVLITRFMTTDGIVELQDLMPVSEHQRIVRRISCVRGRMRLHSELAPRFDYGRTPHRTRRNRDGVVLATDAQKLTLFSGVDLFTDHGDVHADVAVREGEAVTFVLHVGTVHDPHCHEAGAATGFYLVTIGEGRLSLRVDA